MKTLALAAVLMAVAFFVLVIVSARLKKPAGEMPKRKRLLTEREQAMYNRLVQSLPDCVVLAQVSFGAMLKAKTRAARNRFDRKMADFVVCNKAFQVLAVIELDDASHKGRQDKDAARSALLEGAGYRVIRYANVPDIDKVRADFMSGAALDQKTKPEGRTPQEPSL